MERAFASALAAFPGSAADVATLKVVLPEFLAMLQCGVPLYRVMLTPFGLLPRQDVFQREYAARFGDTVAIVSHPAGVEESPNAVGADSEEDTSTEEDCLFHGSFAAAGFLFVHDGHSRR